MLEDIIENRNEFPATLDILVLGVILFGITIVGVLTPNNLIIVLGFVGVLGYAFYRYYEHSRLQEKQKVS